MRTNVYYVPSLGEKMMSIIVQFFIVFKNYFVEVLPWLAIGFFLSGLIHEFIPSKWIEGHLGRSGVRPLFYATLFGTVLPICCIGSLPIAIHYIKGELLLEQF